MLVYAVGKNDLPPLKMPDRFRHEIAYFMTPAGEPGVPELQPGEYWVKREDVATWLDDCVVSVVSPLDAEARAEIELSDEQEIWLQWMWDHDVQHIRLEA